MAHFFSRLSRYRDAEGTLLDNTLVLYGSGCSTTHWPKDLPTLVAGGRGMGLSHGRYVREGEQRMANLYLSLLHALGIEEDSFADSTGTLTSPVFG